MALSRDEIYKKVQEVLVDALSVDEEEVTPTSIIRDDLGAESIDFLDIAFRLEKAFPIGTINPSDMTMPESMATDPNLVQNGKLTDAGLAALKARLPFADFTDFDKDPAVEKIDKLFTVNMLVNFVQARLNAPASTAAAPAAQAPTT